MRRNSRRHAWLEKPHDGRTCLGVYEPQLSAEPSAEQLPGRSRPKGLDEPQFRRDNQTVQPEERQSRIAKL